METAQSENIHNGIHFLNGKDNYLFRTYVGRSDNFDVYWELVYLSNEWILGIFNDSGNYAFGYEIKECVKKLGNNHKDWTIVKHPCLV
jgi:hypothetical protein